VLLGELGAEGADGLHHHDLELVRDLRDEAGDLLHETIHARLRPRLQEGRDRQRRDRSVGICRKNEKNFSRVKLSFNSYLTNYESEDYQYPSHSIVLSKSCLKL
jgi:hypothetical protein